MIAMWALSAEGAFHDIASGTINKHPALTFEEHFPTNVLYGFDAKYVKHINYRILRSNLRSKRLMFEHIK
jgi:hypothetical protein